MLLSSAGSVHTVRWANGLNHAGHRVHVISQQSAKHAYDAGVKVHVLPDRGALGYFLMVGAVKKLLKKIQPDLVNAHYASGYGTTARLVGFRPYVLSVWGSDVYSFPYKSPFHKWLVKKNIRAADQVASTSYCMAEQIRLFNAAGKSIDITPFGVDLSGYEGNIPAPSDRKLRLVIGTVKGMSSTYGVDTLIRAFDELVKRLAASGNVAVPQLELRLVGSGDQKSELKALAEQLGISDRVNFVGSVPHHQVPSELEKMDIYVALSRSESFGVAIIEASAAGRPVVVSDAGGLQEVTLDGVTGFVVPRENPGAAADALECLINDAELRHQMGVAGQRHVARNYRWDFCIQKMVEVYEKTICNFK